ncbi:MAG: large-conductance mechanosensitive channel protein MscL [Ignavibacteria bacterium]|nr:large-conductance mechanosensitive channel protein MscL [Ignavibacteria bacterium]
MSLYKEFKTFAMRGNVVDLAVGFIMGAAFGKIVTSLVNDVIMPPVGVLLGGVDFSGLMLTIKSGAEGTKAVTLNYGVFINTVIDFLIVASAVFLLVRVVNALKRKEEAAPAAPTQRDCPECLMPIPINAKRCGTVRQC